MSIQIAITGASGHIGNVVCRKLLENGYRVKALYHSDKSGLEGLNVELIQGSTLNKNDLSNLIDGCEIVINCAAIISINGDPKGDVFRTNTEGPKNVLEVAIEKGVKKLIHLSSVHAVTELPHSQTYDETRPYKTKADFVYDYSKAIGEQLLLNTKHTTELDVVIVRPSCVVGPFDFKPSKMGVALLDFYKQKIPFLPFGGYDLVDVRDVANAIITAITKGNNKEIYLLSGKYYSLKELSQEVRTVTGKKVPTTVLPYAFLKCIVPFATAYYKISRKTPTITNESIAALKNGHPAMDNSKAKRDLGFKCRPLVETLTDFYAWQKEKKVI